MLSGYSIIGGKSQAGDGDMFTGIDPSTGAALDPPFHYASLEDMNFAADLAEEAFAIYGKLPGHEKAHFLRHIAAGLDSAAAEVIARARLETALPEARLKGELARTANQLLLFARLVEDGSWVNARIDPAEPQRKPLPRADIRSMLRPLGPIAVFGSSNFPLAFSVAGGDTASALAGGNPVIVKAHSAHPGTSELVGQVISRSVSDCGLPPGVFALLFGAGRGLGGALVEHPHIKGVGFTGSLSAGKSLMDRAAARPEPIPCFMEMSSVNPVIVLPEALRTRAAQIAGGLFASFTLGVGQFCTKPGLVFLPRNGHADEFVAELKKLVEPAAISPMLTEGISDSYRSGMAQRSGWSAVETVAEAVATANCGTYAVPAVLQVDSGDLERHPELLTEIFGPATLVVRYEDRQDLLALLSSLEGQLTATLHGSGSDLADSADLIATLERKAGRLIVNGFPTGVEVCHAMVHGGPYPATSDSRATSVGALAIYRFVRPVCFQDFPDFALPDELKDSNPLGIWRMVNGSMTRDPVQPAA